MDIGKFVISLDFELMWGVRDSRTIKNYGENIMGVHTVIPKLLSMFSNYNIKGTFSTVGFLFFENKKELHKNLPEHKPQYKNKNLSPYENNFSEVEDNFEHEKYHFAPGLIKLIQDCPGQEIGTHTFCHYYCLEDGQTILDFREDIQKAIEVAQKYNIRITSLVFPRNQFNSEYLKVCTEYGIICFRGNEKSWLYTAKSGENETKVRRAFRLIDSYINISGEHCYSDEYMRDSVPVNIPASRFLRPYSKKLKIFDTMRLHRIKSGMSHAAKNGLTYHLWWHPHNFGINQDENFNFLENILIHYRDLHQKFHFQSYTMSGLAELITTQPVSDES